MTADPYSMSYSALPEGVVLNQAYQIMKVLGAGGFGITYLAWDTVRERHVVIKECLPGDYALREEGTYCIHPISGETASMFHNCLVNARQEAETLARVSNPGVVRIFDLFEEYGTFYYVMEYLDGETLHTIMLDLKEKNQPLLADQAEGLLVNILEILDDLHKQKIYHCDIKPGNIFIMPDGKPKLIDFGAVRSKELQHEGLIQITPGYTPPEFYPHNLRELGPWSDVYELGATFYELLTGNVPEPSNQRFKVDRMVKISSIESLRNRYPLILLSSIDRALSPDHRNRFPSAKAWIEYLDSYGSGRQIKTINPHSRVGARMKAAGMPNLKKKKKNHTALIMFIVLLLILAGAAFGIKQGAINIDAYPELSFIKKLLGMPEQPEKTQAVKTGTTPGESSPTTEKGKQEPQPEKPKQPSESVLEPGYQEEVIEADEIANGATPAD